MKREGRGWGAGKEGGLWGTVWGGGLGGRRHGPDESDRLGPYNNGQQPPLVAPLQRRNYAGVHGLVHGSRVRWQENDVHIWRCQLHVMRG